jgi:hypothetical protein
MQEVGHALGADLVFTGLVQALEVDARAGAVRLTLYVEAVDQVSGQLVVATRETASVRRSDSRPEPTDVLVTQALAQAADKAAETTALGPRAQGEVSDPRDGKTVAVKVEVTGGLRSGQRLLIYRPATEGDAQVPDKLIAAAMVMGGEGAIVEAKVLARSGDIHTGDLAVTVGDAPAREGGPPGGSPR